MIEKTSIGKIIKILRNKKNITQEELAEKINISKNYLSKVERGLSKLNVESFLNMAEVLSFSLEDFGITINKQNITDTVKQKLIEKILSSSSQKVALYSKVIDFIDTIK